MAWTEGDLQALAVGMAIGGKWNNSSSFLPAPSADPPAGPYYGQILHVQLSTSVPDAIIFYTVDGSIPGPESLQFNSAYPIEVGEDTSIKAFVQKGRVTSLIAEIKYRVSNPFLITETVYITDNIGSFTDNPPGISTEYVEASATDTFAVSDAIATVLELDVVVEIITG